MNSTVYFLFNAFAVSVCSYVWIFILSQPGMIFGSFASWLHKKLEKNKHSRLLRKVLIECCYCNTGQIALWSYIFMYDIYNIFWHIVFVCVAIMISKILITKYGRE